MISHDGVRTVIVALGINDLGNYPNETVIVDDITDGMRQLADRLHRAGLTVIMATLTPFAVATLPGYYSLEKDAKRMQINQFIRSAPYWDGVVDFEAALADPANPLRMLPAYDSGDHLHPNDAGMKALADAVTWLDDPSLPIDAHATTVGAGVPATLALTLGTPPSFGALVPGVTKDYAASTTATVTSTAADAALTYSDPGHLMNGTFALPSPLTVTLSKAAWTGPVSNDAVTIGFAQHVDAADALRTGTYSKQLTFTLVYDLTVSAPEASLAPSARAPSFAHWIDSCTRWMYGPWAKPQSVDPSTRSGPTRRAVRSSRSATSSGCSTTLVACEITPGASRLPSGSSTSSHTFHS